MSEKSDFPNMPEQKENTRSFLRPIKKETENPNVQPLFPDEKLNEDDKKLGSHKNNPITRYAKDLFCDVGTPVLAADDGIIVVIKEDSDTHIGLHQFNQQIQAGANQSELFLEITNLVGIEHADGTFTEYIHLAKGSVQTLGLKLGDKIKKGQNIGETGLSGVMNMPHLHFNAFKLVDNEPDQKTPESIPFE